MKPNIPLTSYFARASSIQTCCNIIFNMIFLEPITLHQKKTRQKMEQPNHIFLPLRSRKLPLSVACQVVFVVLTHSTIGF
jgi:hypothetical protein